MSKLISVQNFEQVKNRDKSNEQIIRYDVCDELLSCLLYRDLDVSEDEIQYDVNMYFKGGRFVASYDKFDDARRLMEDLVHTLQNKDHHFVEIDLLDYVTK